MASSAYLRVKAEAATLSPTWSGGSRSPPRLPSTHVHRQQTVWLAGALAQAELPSHSAEAMAGMTPEQVTVSDFLRDVSTADLGEAVKLTKARLQRLRSKASSLGPAHQPYPRSPSVPDATTSAAKAAESKWRDTRNLLLLRRLSFDKNHSGNKNQASGRGAPSHPRPTPKRHARPPFLNNKQRRFKAKRDREAISDHIVYMGLHPEHFGGLRREYDGSFSIESLMSYWGNSVGLTAETILKALREHLLMGVDGGKPKLRFSMSQGSDSSDSVWIKVRQSAGL